MGEKWGANCVQVREKREYEKSQGRKQGKKEKKIKNKNKNKMKKMRDEMVAGGEGYVDFWAKMGFY